MARRIFQQPDGLFAEYSTQFGFTKTNASKEQIIKHAYEQNASWGRSVGDILNSPNNDGSYNGISNIEFRD